MNNLIKCPKYVPKITERTSPGIICCLNCNAELVFTEKKEAFYQCGVCGAVFTQKGLVPFDKASELFPADVIMDY